MRHLPVIDQHEYPRTGLCNAVLHEVLAALEAFLESDAVHAIDLRALPLTDPDRAELDARLGHGEVAATLKVAGQSVAWETRYPGVWRVQHCGEDGAAVAETIEITRIPELLMSPPQDVAAARERLARDLAHAAQSQGHS